LRRTYAFCALSGRLRFGAENASAQYQRLSTIS
jgi:hypothetical protein